jgi:hypothetical protein
MNCVHCEQQIPDYGNFCLWCGVVLASGTTPVKPKLEYELCAITCDEEGTNFTARVVGPRGGYIVDESDHGKYNQMIQRLVSSGWDVTGSESIVLTFMVGQDRDQTVVTLHKLQRAVGHPQSRELVYTTDRLPYPDYRPPKQGFLKSLVSGPTNEERLNLQFQMWGSDHCLGELLGSRINVLGEEEVLVRRANLQVYIEGQLWLPRKAVRIVG